MDIVLVINAMTEKISLSRQHLRNDLQEARQAIKYPCANNKWEQGSLCSLCSEAGKGARSASGNHTFIQLKLRYL